MTRIFAPFEHEGILINPALVRDSEEKQSGYNTISQ
jgi:hypothetical protein